MDTRPAQYTHTISFGETSVEVTTPTHVDHEGGEKPYKTKYQEIILDALREVAPELIKHAIMEFPHLIEKIRVKRL